MKAVFGTLVVLLALTHCTLSLSIGSKAEKKKVVCYFGSWSVYRYGDGLFDVEDINPFICTHLIFTFAGLDPVDNVIMPLDPYNELCDNWGKCAYERFVALKRLNPEVKTILAIGGWNEGSEKYSKMVSDPALRAKFTDSVIDFMLRFGFDGFDFDWEYPANRGGEPEDKDNFISMSRELRAALDRHGLMLTVAVSCGKFTIDTAYNVPAMSQIYDQIHLMCYDFHGAWEDFTGHNAPLYGNPDIDFGNNSYFNTNFAVDYWLSLGASPSKLILGMPLYGRGFTLSDPDDNGLYAPAPQPIDAGPYTGTAGFWGYNEILEKFAKEDGWTIVRDPVYMAPYAYRGRQWIGYDDEQSLALKTRYMLAKGLGGAMVWSVETDDFRGLYSQSTFPLTRTVYEILNGPVTEPTPDPEGTTRRTTTASPGPDGICREPGFVRDPEDCAKFYQCTPDGQGGWNIFTFYCSPGTVFDPQSNSCAYPNEVAGCEDYTPPFAH